MHTRRYFCLKGEILQNRYFQHFDRSNTRHDRAKTGLAGQHDRPPFKNLFELCKHSGARLLQYELDCSLHLKSGSKRKLRHRLDFRSFLKSGVRGRNAGSFPEQRLVIEPNWDTTKPGCSTVQQIFKFGIRNPCQAFPKLNIFPPSWFSINSCFSLSC